MKFAWSGPWTETSLDTPDLNYNIGSSTKTVDESMAGPYHRVVQVNTVYLSYEPRSWRP